MATTDVDVNVVEPVLVTVRQARLMLGGIGRDYFTALLRSGQIASFPIGAEVNSKRMVLVSSLRVWAERQAQAGTPPEAA